MNTNLLEAFEHCRTDPATDEGRVAALVARVLDPALDSDAIEAELEQLARGCITARAPWTNLAELGFAGNSDDYGALDNSNLAWVLRTRRGIPITLGVVLIRVARAAGRHAVGINFPGHFVVRVDDVLVDPFALEPLDEQHLLERLPAASRQLSQQVLFAPAGTVAVGLRMLNNVKAAYLRQAAWDRTLDVIDAQIALAPEQPALHLERGDTWLRIGLAAPAREAFRRALELTPAGTSDELEQVRRVIRARLDQLGEADDILH